MSSSTPPPSPPQPTERANPGLLDAILASATDYALITTDENGIIATWNKGAEQIFDYVAAEIVGMHIAEIFTSEDRANDEAMKELVIARDTGRSSDIRWHRRKDGSCFWAEGVMTPIKNAEGTITGYLKILRDDTQRKDAECKLIELARVDMLTGAANRAALQERLGEMSAHAVRNKEVLILQLLDLDNFKAVNDKWGHPAGDKLLQQVTQRIRQVVRDTDFIARLGGDEFVILQPDAKVPEAGGALAEKLVEALSRPFEIDGNEIMTGVSIGIVLFPQDEKEPGQLLRKADLALYKVKNNSRNGYHYFSEELDTDAHNKRCLLAALKRAVEEHSFWLEYQPEIATGSGQTVAVEALLRCRDPILASHNIKEIITLATATGLMPAIGSWVMEEACAQSRKWQDAGLPTVRMCVNLCPRELLAPKFADFVGAILKRNNLTAGNLEVEITERDLFDKNQGWAIVTDLRSLGISIAIDDFGTGYSALSQLRDLPVDRIKLDQFFLSKIPLDPESCALAAAMISLAHTLSLEVVVEGVESADQAAFFERVRCEAMQGNFFSRPLRAAEMTDWLSRHQQGRSWTPGAPNT